MGSDYIHESDYDHIRRLYPQAQIEALESAGHWVHAEAPDAVYELITHFAQ